MSKKYKIEIIETLSKAVEVKANSLEEAIDKVQIGYSNEEYILDADSFKEVQIQPSEDEIIKNKIKKDRESR